MDNIQKKKKNSNCCLLQHFKPVKVFAAELFDVFSIDFLPLEKREEIDGEEAKTVKKHMGKVKFYSAKFILQEVASLLRSI